MSFKKSIKVGVTWSSASQLGRQALQILTTVILARLLNPSDFGLVSMAMIVVGIAVLIKDLGSVAAIIQRKSVSQEFLSSIYWANLAAGLAITVIFFVLSPLIASLFNEPRVTLILQVLSLSFAVSSFGTVRQAILERNSNFKALAQIELTATGLGAIVGVSLAISKLGAWSLVAQYMVTTTLTAILLVCRREWRPYKYFRIEELKSIGNFSLNLIGFNLVNFFIRNSDSFLIGRFWGAQNLGYYTLAYQIMLFPLQNISAVVNRVLFPVYSQMQDDNKAFKTIYLKISGAIALITIPLMAGLFLAAKPFVLTVLGPEWLTVSILLMIFAPIGLIQSLGTMVGVIYQAKGRTDWMFRWSLLTAVIVIFGFFMGIRWGIVGVAVSYLMASILLSYPNFFIPFKLVHLKVSELIKFIRPILYCSIIMFLVLMAAKFVLPKNISSFQELGILIFSGIAVYGLLIWNFHRHFAIEILDIMKLKT
jgi:O-antigen/teichoic acid export membrane protein